MNFLVPIGISLVLVAGIGFQQWRLEKKSDELAEWKQAATQYQEADEANQLAIAECQRISDQNKAEADSERERAAEAAERVVSLREQLEQRMEAIDVPTIVGDCPAANDPDFGNWLYSDSP